MESSFEQWKSKLDLAAEDVKLKWPRSEQVQSQSGAATTISRGNLWEMYKAELLDSLSHPVMLALVTQAREDVLVRASQEQRQQELLLFLNRLVTCFSTRNVSTSSREARELLEEPGQASLSRSSMSSSASSVDSRCQAANELEWEQQQVQGLRNLLAEAERLERESGSPEDESEAPLPLRPRTARELVFGRDWHRTPAKRAKTAARLVVHGVLAVWIVHDLMESEV